MNSNSKKQFWDLKPFWCQPWTIITFGILTLFFSWLFFKNIIITLILAFIIIIWWLVFLIILPRSYLLMSETNNQD